MRTAAAALAFACILQSASAQERAPNGEIYNELRPFVGLEGVRVQVFGLGGGVYNFRPQTADPAKAATGLSQRELDDLNRSVNDDIAAAFNQARVQMVTSSREAPDRTPRLEVDIHWQKHERGVLLIRVNTKLREAVRLVRDPSVVVWASTWEAALVGYPTTPMSLVKDVRHVALGGVNEFLTLYQRAHAH